IVNELEAMSKEDKINKIQSYLVRMMVHLIKNQIELRLTNSWVASISDSLLQIKRTNLKDNKTSYYIKLDEWQPMLEEALEAGIRPASVEVLDGRLKPGQLSEMIDRIQIAKTAERLLALTYEHSPVTLPNIIDTYLAQLPGGEDWLYGRE
ncbi:MAG TPA: DUF29 family protein, partial [Kamptonema sp.]|nr:DUF29 family protein [Kamptonema sp.]